MRIHDSQSTETTVQKIPGLMLQSLNRLLAGVRKKIITHFASHSKISPEHSGNSLISLQHLERRLNIDLFGLLCFVGSTVSIFKGMVI